MKLYQASSYEIYVFKSFDFNITHLASSSHLTPLPARMTNKELSANSFMTKMMNEALSSFEF